MLARPAAGRTASQREHDILVRDRDRRASTARIFERKLRNAVAPVARDDAHRKRSVPGLDEFTAALEHVAVRQEAFAALAEHHDVDTGTKRARAGNAMAHIRE